MLMAMGTQSYSGIIQYCYCGGSYLIQDCCIFRHMKSIEDNLRRNGMSAFLIRLCS